ncbi:MAG: immunity 17 family protein [Tannerellaceae bacterium]|jgi:small neutral amino acid transporter SnatA (MarC family)|nr:immunity 17 family protein [Tannerellaceae bacterium]
MTFAEYFILGLFVFLGFLSITAALFNFEWYFRTSSARTFVNILGRSGARIFYGLLGLALIVCGVAGYLQWSA